MPARPTDQEEEDDCDIVVMTSLGSTLVTNGIVE
jgi:hypothetical protein